MDKPQYLGSKIRWDYVKAAIPDHKDFAVHGIALDIGAEGGLYRDLIKSKGYDYRGCDIDPKGIAIEKCDAYDLETLELYDKCDLIIFVDVLEHLDDPEKAIKEMKHCLKPGGTLIFHTPNINQSNILFKHSQHPDHKVEGFKREQLLDLFKDFDLTLTKTFNFLECVGYYYI